MTANPAPHSHTAPRRRVRLQALALLAALIGCAPLPPAPPPGPSTLRVAPNGTPVARWAAASGLPPKTSGFQSLPLSGLALQTRLVLMQQAQAGIDLQTFHLADDATGHQLLRGLRDAAARGVRVRLLLDDFHTARMDELLLATAAQPGIELRLYNPFGAGREYPPTRLIALLADFERLNRRMHNKLFIVDGQVAIVGGRNLADEYFMRSERANFIDLDLLCAGPVAAELGHHFDRYWNSPHAWPVQALADDGRTPAQRRELFDQLTHPGPVRPMSPPPDSGGVQVQALRGGRLPLLQAEAAVYVDSPDKTAGAPPPPALPIASQFAGARSSVLLVSPYFLPSAQGLERMRAARARGVDLQIITNAVADSDEPLVGMAYAARRVAMLRMGVRLYELSSVQLKRGGPLQSTLGDATGRLHLKLALLDDETLFIGSFNLDPRSAATNTELAVRVRSRTLARQVLDELERVRQGGLLRLQLAEDGQTVEWYDAEGRQVHRGPVEPGLGTWQQLRLQWLLGLVPEALL